MRQATAPLEQKVRRFALTVAALLAVGTPCLHAFIAYDNLADALDFKAKVKASALSSLIASSPDVWTFAENRLQGLLSREPVPLGNERVLVQAIDGATIIEVGRPPAAPTLQRAYKLHDSGQVVGTLVVSGSMRKGIEQVLLTAAISLVVSAGVYRGLRFLLLAALKMATDAQERAETTLRSIGDAVITTDAVGTIDTLNVVAERMLGVAEAEVRGRPVSDVVRMRDAAGGGPVHSSIHAALRNRSIVACNGNCNLHRRDGAQLAVEESASPIIDRAGAVVGGVLVLRDVTEARQYVERRSWEATHDSLTGLLNRRGFESHVQAAVEGAKAQAASHVLCYLDLDGFKLVNDTAGHPAGDALLVQLALLLQGRIRDTDVLARLGGDEFGLLLKHCEGSRGEVIAADVLQSINEFSLRYADNSFRVGVSVGLTVITGDHTGVAEVFSEADCACYLAKEQGKNRVLRFAAGDTRLAARRSEAGWVQRISDAIKHDRFVLYHQSYQALNATGGQQEHLEVLLRMRGEDGEVIAPGRFLPAAERFNLMPAIDRWVIRAVFSRHRELVAARCGATPICAINLSGASLNSEGMLAFLRDQVREHGADPKLFCLELTETVAVNSLQVAVEFIRECRAMGFRFALDDFGTGTSSFGYLKNLPVDYLKIDGSFVKNIEHDTVDEAMVEAINRIGHLLGKRTVAEYAENEAIIAKLRALGVDFAQGYGVCRPKPLFAEEALVVAAAEAVLA